MSTIEILLLQIAVILVLSRLMGLLMRIIHQPQVVGEMIVGIMLGPSLLGLFHHGVWMNTLFPEDSIGNLNVLAQLGVMIFMFLVGLELEPKLLQKQGRFAFIVGMTGIVAPFLCGVALALGLVRFMPDATGRAHSRLLLALFIGTAMSITAFPVLARILTERNLHKTRSGAVALACAAMNDVMGWCILAFVLAAVHLTGIGGGDGAAHGASPLREAGRTVLLALIFIAIMVFFVRKLLGRLQAYFDTRGYLSQNVLAVVFLLLLGSSLATSVIGIHQIFGAFMLGAVMPKDGAFIRHLSEKVEDFTVLFLLPLFFAYTGLRTDLGLLHSTSGWLTCGLVVAVAVIGKFGGVAAAARICGMPWRQSSLLGILMNTRGLMELIILNIGLTFGILSSPLFAMMVVMAVVTTIMTTPLMHLVYSPARQKKEMEEAALEEAEKVPGVHVVVPVSLLSTAPSLVRVGTLLMGNDPGRLYALHLDRPEEVEWRARNAMTDADEVLDAARRVAKRANVTINTVSFISRNIGRDISDAAKRYHASWVVMGWHKPVFFKSVLGATVGQVIHQAPANVAILIDKGLGDVKRIVVPYLGEHQDRGALLAAERLGRKAGVSVTILHVVKPGRPNKDKLEVQTEIEREFPSNGGESVVRMNVVESDSPIDVVVEASRQCDLMIVGLSADWNLQGVSIFGKNESVAQLAHCSLLIVHASPLAPVYRQAAPIAAGMPVATDPAPVG